MGASCSPVPYVALHCLRCPETRSGWRLDFDLNWN
jgi:hypothetical protein